MKVAGFEVTNLEEVVLYDIKLYWRYAPGEPSRVMGPPEDCHEGSPDQFEWSLIGTTPNGTAIDITDLMRDTDEEWIRDIILGEVNKI